MTNHKIRKDREYLQCAQKLTIVSLILIYRTVPKLKKIMIRNSKPHLIISGIDSSTEKQIKSYK